jgi:hypothetical protein
MRVFEVVGYTAVVLAVGMLVGRVVFGRRRRTGRHALCRSTVPTRPDYGLDEQWSVDLHRMVRDMRADTTDVVPLPLIAGDEPPCVAGFYEPVGRHGVHA